jgi:arylsulfatase A-like enzyme
VHTRSLGWHNTQLSNPEVHSPNIVALQQSGIALSRLYAYRYCSPTRCSLLSGRLPHHVSEANFQNDYVGGFIHRNMTIIADKLKAQGYRTAHVGKWCDQLSIDANINNMPEFAIES